jgi:hypothetical protein
MQLHVRVHKGGGGTLAGGAVYNSYAEFQKEKKNRMKE